MKVYIGTMHRVIFERKCGCRAAQEFKDAAMKEPDGEGTFKPCAKHKRGQVGEIIREIMIEVLENRAEEHRSKTVIAIAEANANKVATPAPVGEGAESESRVAIKVGDKVVQRPASVPAASAAPVTPSGHRDTTKPRQVNLASGSGSGLRRATQQGSAAAVVAEKKTASAPVVSGNSIDAEFAGVAVPVTEDIRITKVLVDGEGGLLGPDENDSTGET
jgi:hypothetical protein